MQALWIERLLNTFLLMTLKALSYAATTAPIPCCPLSSLLTLHYCLTFNILSKNYFFILNKSNRIRYTPIKSHCKSGCFNFMYQKRSYNTTIKLFVRPSKAFYWKSKIAKTTKLLQIFFLSYHRTVPCQ